MNPWHQAQRILAVRLDNIGDVVMLGPALRAVKATSPEASITLLASPAGTLAAPLLPWIDDVITYRPVWQDVHGRIPFDPARELEFAQMLHDRHFDAALIFTSFSQSPHVPGYVCYLAGIPLRAGDSREFAGGVLTTEVRGTPDDIHQVDRSLLLVESVGFPVGDRRLAVSIDAAARAAVPELLVQAGLNPDLPFVLLHPGASAEARRYPPERFGLVARGLAGRGYQVLVTGVSREADVLAVVRGQAPDVGLLLDASTLAQYAALIERAALVLCGNTLPLHLADAFRTPLVALYSGTDLEEQWRPRDTEAVLLRRPTPCYPCYLFQCPIGLPCLDIDPSEVVEVAQSLMARRRPAIEVAG